MSDPSLAGKLIELRATAHLMLLDPGTFCVFNAPGSAAPDARTGLPSVRLSAPPGASGGQVTLSGVPGEGWLGGRDDAALLRVSGGPAHILVTIYQAADATGDAPKLQVLRLSEPARPAAQAAPTHSAAQAAPTHPAAQAAPTPPVEVMAHVYGRGDVPGRFGEWLGERGSRRWIEGFAMQPLRLANAADLEYQAVLGRGWMSPWAEAGQFCGSRGMSLPILGLRARLRGPAAAAFTLSVSASFVDGSASGPVLDGEVCEAPSLAALEAFQVSLQPKEQTGVDAPPRPPAKRKR